MALIQEARLGEDIECKPPDCDCELSGWRLVDDLGWLVIVGALKRTASVQRRRAQ